MADATSATERTITCTECGQKSTGSDLLEATTRRDRHEQDVHQGGAA